MFGLTTLFIFIITKSAYAVYNCKNNQIILHFDRKPEKKKRPVSEPIKTGSVTAWYPRRCKRPSFRP